MSEPEEPSETIEATCFILRDAARRIRARLAVEPDGASSLALLDSNGLVRASLMAANDGTSGLQLSDAQGKPRVILCHDGDQPYAASVTFVLNGKTHGGIRMCIAEDGSSSLEFLGDAGHVFLELPRDMQPKPS